MSLFRKPKKIQRRVFSSALGDDEDSAANGSRGGSNSVDGDVIPMDVDEDLMAPPPPTISFNKKEKKDKPKESSKHKSGSSSGGSSKSTDSVADGKNSKQKALLSFADDGKLLSQFTIFILHAQIS